MRESNPTPAGDNRSLAELASASAAGDREAFGALHRRLSGGLRKLFMDRSSGRADVSDDLIQRTWTGVWQALSAGRYDPSRSAISTFVYAVAHKMWLQHLRARGPIREMPPVEAVSTAEEPQADTDLAEVLEAIRACLRGQAGDLSEEDRAILRLSGMGASDRDLAARLGVSPSTANARKRAAFDRIRRHLAGLGHRPEIAERMTRASE